MSRSMRKRRFPVWKVLNEVNMHETPQRLAAIDTGSNTIHLVVAEAISGDLRIVADELELVRLGADVGATGAIGEERAARAIATIRAQVALAHSLGATTILGIATEGVRAAANAHDFLRRVADETGVGLELVTGEQEASLTYWGVASEEGTSVGTSGERRAVVDLGGGSMEIVLGHGSAIEWRTSLPLGSGTIHDRYAPADPPVASELATARDVVASVLRQLKVPLPVELALACGGTATTLAWLSEQALAGGNAQWSGASETNDAYRTLSRARLEELLALLQSIPAVEVARRYKVDEVRARLIGAGAVVLLAAMDRLGVDALRVSRRGIREGALLAYLRVGERWLEVAASGEGW